jgi:hypothetical protein
MLRMEVIRCAQNKGDGAFEGISSSSTRCSPSDEKEDG